MIHRTGFSRKVFEHIAKEHNFDMEIQEVGFDLLVDVKKH
jgi:hypothetical protein